MRKQSISARLLVKGLLLVGLVLVFGVRLSAPIHATEPQLVGMVVDNQTLSVTVFDPASNTVRGSVSIGSGFAIGDCSITADGTLGFVTNYDHKIWVIDLTSSFPSLAGGTNPIPISNIGEDTSISPDQNFLVVVDGSGTQPISVIDIATRAEISTFSVSQQDHSSVEVLSDGSVLVTSVSSGNIHRLILDGAGNLTDTGEVLFSGGSGGENGPNNVFAAPDAMSGIVVRRNPQEIRSFTIPGLSFVDVRSLTGGFVGISGLVNPAGDRAYARSSGNDGVVNVFVYNSATGSLGSVPLFSIPIPGTNSFFGMDQMAITPDGTKLYVSRPNAVNVYDSGTGSLLTSITDSQIVDPTGVCFNEPAVEPTAIDLTAQKSNDINGTGEVGIPFSWTINLANMGLTDATFDPGEVILQDVLPDSPTYGSPTPGNFSGITGSNFISCSIESHILTCMASGGPVTIGSNDGFDVVFNVTPTVPGTLDNPAHGGICQVDPNNLVAETNEGNNHCTDSVTVEEPTAINLASFKVEANEGQATVIWETATEIDNAGFNIYRATAPDGPWTQVNSVLIAAEGDPVSGAHYTFTDTPGRGTFYYHLEDIDFFGISTLHEPALVDMGAAIRIPWYRPSLPAFE